MRAVYVLGGAGTGKSTFMAELLKPWSLGPLEEVHTSYVTRKSGRRNTIRVRGHWVDTPAGERGFYLGHMREAYPGTDGLDRACGPATNEWLRAGAGGAEFVVAEGALFANQRQLPVLAETSELVLMHLTVDEMVADLRFLARGSSQAPSFVKTTVTRSRNITEYMQQHHGTPVVEVDTEDPAAWAQGIETARSWLTRR